MPDFDRAEVVRMLTTHGFNIDPAAVERLLAAPDPEAAIEGTLASVPASTIKITTQHVQQHARGDHPSVSGGEDGVTVEQADTSPPETMGGERGSAGAISTSGDITGESTGTGTYDDFVDLFRDRYERLSSLLSGRLTHRSTHSLGESRSGTDVGLIGLVSDIRSTRNGHTLLELEDTTGAFPVLVTSDREVSAPVDTLLLDEVIGVEGTLSDDGEIVFADELYQPDVPRTHQPRTADRHVQAALISDVHVGSAEFLRDAWEDFASWLHSSEAEAIEYLLIAGDMVEGVGVYPGQADDLTVVDIYEQYRAFSESLKAVPGDLEIVIIPGNHDAVRRAEPQPAIDDDLAETLDAHDPTLVGNPSMVEIEGVRILMYHGVSLDELVAELPTPDIAYETPHEAMITLLKKRHLGPPYGGKIRIAPEKRDYLVIDEVPDVFHAGHTHTFGVGSYRGVRVVNSGCWQAQTDFQRRNNLQPDVAHAPIVSLDTLEITVRKFR